MRFCEDGAEFGFFLPCYQCKSISLLSHMTAGPWEWLDAIVAFGFLSSSRENGVSSECSGPWEDLGSEKRSEALEGKWSEASGPTEPKKEDTPHRRWSGNTQAYKKSQANSVLNDSKRHLNGKTYHK